MPYTVTLLKPERSKHGTATSPSGEHFNHEPQNEVHVLTFEEALEAAEAYIDDAQDALGEEEGARAYFEPARKAAFALSEEDGGTIELPDGWTIVVVSS
jgi:hypothetical protein